MKTFILAVFFLLKLLEKVNCVNKGALISTEFNGEVGILLDEIPNAYGTRNQIIEYIIKNMTEKEWNDRALLQIQYVTYRQVYRQWYYNGKGQLTLPPVPMWKIKFTENPKLRSRENHQVVSRKYSFYSVLVATANTVNISEPALTKQGGKFCDEWPLPIDPETFLQRTSYACIDEAGYPLDSINSENAWTAYDFGCKVEPFIPDQNRTYELNLERCHWTVFPKFDCLDALKKYVGTVTVKICWKRLAWSEKVASKWRYGEQLYNYPDLKINSEDFQSNINVGYSYFKDDSCALKEGASDFSTNKGCIDKPGWRQLLKFTSSQINMGKVDLSVGSLKNPLFTQNHVYEFDPCHQHYHFQHYLTASMPPKASRKIGFCIVSSWRYHNNEDTSLNTIYNWCDNQGIAAGWGDDYFQGIDCQWIDVTTLAAGRYSFHELLNPNGFLCEGTPLKYSNGTLEFEKTNFTTFQNETVYRETCNFGPGYENDNNNTEIIDFSGKESIVTLPCRRRIQLTPKKDCGFQLKLDNLSCKPNKTTTFKFKKSSNRDLIVRICESSVKLGHSTYCEYVDALANNLFVGDTKTTFSINFKCPSRRSDSEPGGSYSILASTLIPGASIPAIIPS